MRKRKINRSNKAWWMIKEKEEDSSGKVVFQTQRNECWKKSASTSNPK